MSNAPIFTGTPDDWWAQAERISRSEAEERTLGNWYIVRMNTAGDTKPNYRLSTPSRPANMVKQLQLKTQGFDQIESERVRLLMRNPTAEPAWRTADYVLADLQQGSEHRVPWARKNSGRWHCLADGRKTINDHVMALLNPQPATFTTENLI